MYSCYMQNRAVSRDGSICDVTRHYYTVTQRFGQPKFYHISQTLPVIVHCA
jgi:hypothetical protein